MSADTSSNCQNANPIYAAFLAALPTILGAARSRFRHVHCSDTREDLACEAVALCWLWYVRLLARGRDPRAFMSALARYGAVAASSGRRVCGLERVSDALSRRCQRRRGFTVSPLPAGSAMIGNVFDEALIDNARTPVPDQVQFRVDFPAWVGALPAAKRRVVALLSLGHRTAAVAEAVGVSDARVSQLRRELCADYAAFCDGAAGE